jgi:hypothetical protein
MGLQRDPCFVARRGRLVHEVACSSGIQSHLALLLPAGPDDSGRRRLLGTSSAMQCNAEVPFPFGNATVRSVDHRDLGTVTAVRNQKKVSGPAFPGGFVGFWSSLQLACVPT